MEEEKQDCARMFSLKKYTLAGENEANSRSVVYGCQPSLARTSVNGHFLDRQVFAEKSAP